MAQQWLRACNVVVGGQTITLADGANNSLAAKFHVQQYTFQTMGTMVLRIYNLSEPTASSIQKQGEFAPVSLNAGYISNMGEIFSGNVQFIGHGKETPVDTFLDIFAANSDSSYNWAPVNKTLGPGSTLMDHVNTIVQAMPGITLGYVPTELLQSIKFPRSVSFFGLARDYLRTIAATIKATWNILGNELYIVPFGQSVGGVTVLNPSTGLIGIPEVTIDGIRARALINPQIKRWSQVQIDGSLINYDQFAFGPSVGTPGDPSGELTGNVAVNMYLQQMLNRDNGIYNVMVIEYTGETRGNPWYMDMQLFSPGATIPSSVTSRFGGPGGVYVPNEAGAGGS